MSDIVFFPGMGADANLAPFHEAIPGKHHWVEWADPAGARSLDEYNRQIRVRVPAVVDPVFVGISFGGLPAMALAAEYHAQAVFLIGSLTDAGELAPWLRAAGVFRHIAPSMLFHPHFMPTTLVAKLFGLKKQDHIHLFARMAAGYDGDFIKRLSGFALTESESSRPPCPVYRVHGRRDKIISRPRFADLSVDGGHVISMTHHDEVNDFITRRLLSS